MNSWAGTMHTPNSAAGAGAAAGATANAAGTGGVGRYAPSPTGDLHFGNLRTAVAAWLLARADGLGFVVRADDLDSQRCREHFIDSQLADLQAIGLDWDDRGAELRQSDREAAYAAAVDKLAGQGLVYECYCSRKEIQQAASAPHQLPGEYPGTCRDLSEAQRVKKREELAGQGRVPALRLRAGCSEFSITDRLHGEYTGRVDDFIVRRGGNAAQARDYAYNLAVVVDDAHQQITQVVRGNDLLSSAPRQAYLAQLLGLAAPEYVHVGLVVNADGQRLAKRDGPISLRTMPAVRVVGEIFASIGCTGATSLHEVLESFCPEALADDYVWEAR